MAKKKVDWLSINQIIAPGGWCRHRGDTSTRRNRRRANICPLFAICTGQKFRTVATLNVVCLRFLIVFICRALCGNINKLSKAVKIFNDCVTPNNRKSICSRRVIYPTLAMFSVCHFLVARLRFFHNATVNSFMNCPTEQLVNFCGWIWVFNVSWAFFQASWKIEHVGNTKHRITYYPIFSFYLETH